MSKVPIGGGSDKIDGAATLGLAGVPNSLAYRVHEIEKHLHGIERWFGSDGDGTASISNNLTEWTLTSGVSQAYGTEVQLLGVNDIVVADFGFIPVKFDLHRILVADSNQNDDTYIIQVWSGETTFGAATLRTEIPYRTGSSSAEVVPIDCQMSRIPVAEKVWARVKCQTDSATLDFTVGIHAYEG